MRVRSLSGSEPHSASLRSTATFTSVSSSIARIAAPRFHSVPPGDILRAGDQGRAGFAVECDRIGDIALHPRRIGARADELGHDGGAAVWRPGRRADPPGTVNIRGASAPNTRQLNAATA